MVEFIIFFACLGALIFSFVKLKKKCFDPFINASKLRFSIWNWTKRASLIALSICLIVASFDRWYYFHDEIAYSKKSLAVDLSYADQIEVEAYLMSELNLVDLFEGLSPNPDRQEMEDGFDKEQKPSDPRFYLVIRVKNKGDIPIYGILEDSVNGKKIREIDVPPLSPNMSDFKNIVLWTYRSERSVPGPYPKIELKWKQIYTLKGEE